VGGRVRCAIQDAGGAAMKHNGHVHDAGALVWFNAQRAKEPTRSRKRRLLIEKVLF